MMDNNTVSSIQSTSSHHIITKLLLGQRDALFIFVPSFDVNIIQAECAKG